MLSALLVTNAIPRTIHIVPRVMMNGWTPSPTTRAPLMAPQRSPMPSDTVRPRAIIVSGSSGPALRSTMAVVTPARA
jgi:hypothetical protein